MRPIREQLEHDRVIRLLQAKYKRKFNVGMNVGSDQVVPVGKGTSAVFPDLVLQASDQGEKLLSVIEVETSESINNLEAMSQWIRFSRLRVPFLLYVPQVVSMQFDACVQIIVSVLVKFGLTMRSESRCVLR